MNQVDNERTGPAAPTEPDGRAPTPRPAPEVHRERELIVTDGGGRRSSPGTAVIVIFAFVALVAIAVLAFTFLQRDGGSIIPDELDVNIEVPEVPSGSGDSPS
jgi:hypothetical protein